MVFKEDWRAGDSGHTAEHNRYAQRLNLSLSVKEKGAIGNGITDDTRVIQNTLDTVDEVYFPKSIYAINGAVGIAPHANQVLHFHPQAVLKVIPNALDHYQTIALSNVDHVQIIGGQIVGDRDTHRGITGEWGMGIQITNCHDILLQDVNVSNCWGDGLYITGGCADIHMIRVVSDNNRRQALSVTSVDGLTVRDSIFKNTNGTSPESGVDLEPNMGEIVQNVTFDNCVFEGSVAYGFIASGQSGIVKRVRLNNCRATGNRRGYYLSRSSQIQLYNCQAYDNILQGVWITFSDDVLINALHARNNGNAGIAVSGTSEQGATNILISQSSLMANRYGVVIGSAPIPVNGVSLIGNRMIGNAGGNIQIDDLAKSIVQFGNITDDAP